LKRWNNSNEMTREERQWHILEAPWNEVFEVKTPHYGLPEKAKLFNTIVCDKCNEGAPEHKIRISEGKHFCLDCFKEYSRGW
jgi:formylmethanofuran dehydrogenase subunit E